MWCMMCKDVATTELVRLISKESILKATKLLANTTLLHVPGTALEVSVSPTRSLVLGLFCAIQVAPHPFAGGTNAWRDKALHRRA